MEEFKYPHEDAARVIRFLAWIQLVLTLALGLAVGIPMFTQSVGILVEVVLLVVFMLIISVLLFYLCAGLNEKKEWAKTGAVIYSFLLFFAFPIGTFLSVYLLRKLKGDYPIVSSPEDDVWR
jgi:hypothetical protein